MRNRLKAILLITLFSVNAIYAQQEFNSLSKLVRLDPKVTYVLMQIEIPILSGLPERKYFYEIHGKHQITDSWASLILEDAIEGRINLYQLACLSSHDSLRLNIPAHSKPTRLLPEKIIPYVYGCPNGLSVEAPDRMDYLIANQLALNHRARVWMFFPVGKKGKPIFAAYDVIWSDPGKVVPDIPLVFTDFVDVTTQKFRVIQDSLSINQYFEGFNYFWNPVEGETASGAWMNFIGLQLPDSWKKSLNQGIIPKKMFKMHLHSPSNA
jgi:hypothetical protein